MKGNPTRVKEKKSFTSGNNWELTSIFAEHKRPTIGSMNISPKIEMRIPIATKLTIETVK